MILVIGGDSMIGRSILAQATCEGLTCSFTSRRPGSKYFVDLSAPSETWCLPPHVESAVFCASMTGLSACDKEPDKSRAVNVTATIALANLLASRGSRIVFLSTNQVFGPDVSAPSEDDLPNPATEYGRQKLAVEQHLLNIIPNSQIIRLTKVVSPELPLFAGWRKTLAAGKAVSAYRNLYFSPIALATTSKTILRIARHSPPATKPEGLFHLSASDSISYLEAAAWLAERFGVAPALVQSTTAPTPNVVDSCKLCCQQTQRLIGYAPPTALEAMETGLAITLHPY